MNILKNNLDYIYKIRVIVDMLGGYLHYEGYVTKCKIKSITDLNVCLDGRRIKRNIIDKIGTSGTFNNSTRVISFIVWTFDENKIEQYKSELIEKIKNQINTFRNELNQLEEKMRDELSFRYSEEEY